MKTDLQIKNAAEVETDCLVVPVVDKGDKDKSSGSVLTTEKSLQEAAQDLIASGELTGKPLELGMLYRPAGVKARRVLFVGGGKEAKFNPNDLRKVAGAAARHLKSKNILNLAIALPSGVHFHADNAVRAAVIGALIADFDPDIYKSDRKDQRIQSLTIVAPKGSDEKLLRSAIEEARIIGEAQNFARELVNEPGNRLTPSILAGRARKMAGETGLECEVLGPDEIKALKMGAFWSVAQGSDEPPALIVLKYSPAGAPDGPVLGLVGKAITFDTGGISIKPADGMEKMKYDMAGGAAMLGAMRAVAQLKPKVKVNAVICASENMPSGKAQKPGDVQIAMSGKSIEIINTDAEGRLVLADGLTYARTKLGCTHLVDAATLTGACVVALGMINAGIFSNDDAMYERFQKALHQAGEKMWRLPLDDEYRDNIKSNIADIVNSGGRYGGAVTAAMFLKEFVEDKPWIHLDIAGTAWVDEAKPFIAKGPSGIAVRSLIEFVRGFEAHR
ncbi:MAG TPA: leucyl aminopeptidase [Terriglobales bacterium]|jgi:leucyl aminopeptidase|nr:leucyl aminopeptidase [Terriglobales bacterium]